MMFKKQKKEKRKRDEQRKADYEIAYLCNGKVPYCRKTGCYYKPPVNGIVGSCEHTLDISYARNKPVKDHPCHHPERFDHFSYEDVDGKKHVRYYEKIGWK